MKCTTLLMLPMAVSCAVMNKPRQATAAAPTPAPGAGGDFGKLLQVFQGGLEKLFQAATLSQVFQGKDVTKAIQEADLGSVLQVAAISEVLTGANPAKFLENAATSALQSTALKAVSQTTLQPRWRADAKRTSVKWGPIDLLAPNATKPFGLVSMDANGQSFFSLVNEGIPRNAAVLGGQLSLQVEDGEGGTIENGVYVHHMLSFDINKKETSWVAMCDTENPTTADFEPSLFNPFGPGNANQGAGFLGIGQDDSNSPQLFTTPDGKWPSGFQLGANDSFLIQSDLVNYNNRTVKVFITMDLEYVPAQAVTTDAKIRLLTVGGCLARAIQLSKTGVANTTSAKFPIYEDGYIVHAKGHMHDGGVAMVLLLNDKEICASKATYGGQMGTMEMEGMEMWETISDMSACGEAIPVKKGDYVALRSVYDLSAHPLRHSAHGDDMEVMGMLGVSFAPKVSGAAASQHH